MVEDDYPRDKWGKKLKHKPWYKPKPEPNYDKYWHEDVEYLNPEVEAVEDDKHAWRLLKSEEKFHIKSLEDWKNEVIDKKDYSYGENSSKE